MGKENKKGIIGIITFVTIFAMLFGWLEWNSAKSATEMGTAMELQVKAIEDCRDGERVKVHGIIQADQNVALSGEFSKSNWDGDVYDFSIIDDTGAVDVIPRKALFDDTAFEVFAAPHEVDEVIYFLDSDEVWAVGTIQVTDDEKTLVLEVISGEEDGLEFPYGDLILASFFLAMNGFFIGFIIIMVSDLKDRNVKSEDSIWINNSKQSAEFGGGMAAGLVVGTLPAFLASFTWDVWLYPCVIYWFLACLIGIKAHQYQVRTERGAKYTFTMSINGRGKFDEMLGNIEREFEKENIVYEKTILKWFGGKPNKIRFDLRDYEVQFNVSFFSYKSSHSIIFNLEPINSFHEDAILIMAEGLIENANGGVIPRKK